MFYYWPFSAIYGEILWQSFAANPCPATRVRIVPGIFCRFHILPYRIPAEIPLPRKVVTTQHWLLAAIPPAHPQIRCAYKYWASRQYQNDPWCIEASWGSFRFLPCSSRTYVCKRAAWSLASALSYQFLHSHFTTPRYNLIVNIFLNQFFFLPQRKIVPLARWQLIRFLQFPAINKLGLSCCVDIFERIW